MKYEVRIGYTHVYTVTVSVLDIEDAEEIAQDLIATRSFKVREYIEHDFTEVNKVND